MKKTKGFLVIDRKRGQSIIIDGNIEVYLSRASGGQASIAVRAPKSIKIQRKEKIKEMGSKDVVGDKLDVTELSSTTSGQGIQDAEPECKTLAPLFI